MWVGHTPGFHQQDGTIVKASGKQKKGLKAISKARRQSTNQRTASHAGGVESAGRKKFAAWKTKKGNFLLRPEG